MNESEPKRAWYLRCSEADVSDRAVLVGDRGRVLIAADMLDAANLLNEDRGLTTVTGDWKGTSITVSAFGMGASIAGIVLHELVSIGVRSVVRLGTALAVGGTDLGDLVVADSALRGEATSGTYAPTGYPAAPDLDLAVGLRDRAAGTGRPVQVGMIASYDGFYSELFADEAMPGSTAVDIERLESLGVVGLDMESSAVLTIGRTLGARAGVVCLASVDGHSHRKLDDDERTAAERDLLRVGFDALSESTVVTKEERR